MTKSNWKLNEVWFRFYELFAGSLGLSRRRIETPKAMRDWAACSSCSKEESPMVPNSRPQTMLKQLLKEWHVIVFCDQSGETLRAVPTQLDWAWDLGGAWESSFSLKILPILIPASAIANNGVTIRDLIGRGEKKSGWGKRKVSTRNFKGEYVETCCLCNERFRSSDEYCVKERNERKEETEKYYGAFHSIEGFAGKRFHFFPPPPSSFLFFCFLSPTFAP